MSVVYRQLEGKRQVDYFYRKLSKTSGGLWKCVQPKTACWWGVTNRCFLWQTDEHTHPSKKTHYLPLLPPLLIWEVFALWLWLTGRIFVITNKPKQTTLLGKHTTSKLGRVVFLPWYWTRQPKYQTGPTNYHERVQAIRPYIERELSLENYSF